MSGTHENEIFDDAESLEEIELLKESADTNAHVERSSSANAPIDMHNRTSHTKGLVETIEFIAYSAHCLISSSSR